MKVDEARMNFSDYETTCRAQWPAVTRATAIPRASCLSDAEAATLLPVSGEFADLVAQRIAFRRAVAVRIANGRTSPEAAQAEFARFNARLSGEAHARPTPSSEDKATLAETFPVTAAATAEMLQAPVPAATSAAFE